MFDALRGQALVCIVRVVLRIQDFHDAVRTPYPRVKVVLRKEDFHNTIHYVYTGRRSCSFLFSHSL